MRERISLLMKRDYHIGRFRPPSWRGRDWNQLINGSRPQHVRMFVLSHLGGPFIGLALSAFLRLLGFPLDIYLGGFTALVCLFWAYPAALMAGASYRMLCLISLQHLTFVILWASYAYGGVASPFLLWLPLVPLLAFLYSTPRVRLWVGLLAILALNTGFFAVINSFAGHPQPSNPDALRWLALFSLLSASAYVSMMAIYFGRVLNSRNEVAAEVSHRRAHVMELDEHVNELRRIRAARIASLSRLARHCSGSVQDILANCGSELQATSDGRSAADPSDLESIRAAALRLHELVTRVDNFRLDYAGPPVGNAASGAVSSQRH
jgi:hypothetical protein